MSHSGAKQQAEQPETLKEPARKASRREHVPRFLSAPHYQTLPHLAEKYVSNEQEIHNSCREKRADSKHVLISVKSLHLSALLAPRVFMYVGVCGKMETRQKHSIHPV